MPTIEVGVNYICDRNHRAQTWKVRRPLGGPDAGGTQLVRRHDGTIPEDDSNPSGRSGFRADCPLCETLVVFTEGTLMAHLDEAEAEYRAGGRRVMLRSLL